MEPPWLDFGTMIDGCFDPRATRELQIFLLQPAATGDATGIFFAGIVKLQTSDIFLLGPAFNEATTDIFLLEPVSTGFTTGIVFYWICGRRGCTEL